MASPKTDNTKLKAIKFRGNLPSWSATVVYNAVILPHFQYMLTVLDLCNKTEIKRYMKKLNQKRFKLEIRKYF